MSVFCFQGLSINTFISDVLSYPIFQIYIDNYELLFYNLIHIFKKSGHEEMIYLQPILIKNVKLLKEKGSSVYNLICKISFKLFIIINFESAEFKIFKFCNSK